MTKGADWVERLLTTTELATYLQRPLGTLYAWRYRGEGPPALKVGRELRYREADVMAWLDGLAEDSKRDAAPCR